MIEREVWGGAPLHQDAGGTLVIAGSGTDAMTAAVQSAGRRLTDCIGWDGAAERLRTLGTLSLLAVDCEGVDDATLVTALPHVHAAARLLDARIVAAFAPAQIDLVAANLSGPDIDLLCDASPLDRVVALTLMLAHGRGQSLREAPRDAEASRLQRLNDEIARIAETLARLSRDEVPPMTRDALADRRPDYAAAPGEAAPPPVTAREVRAAIRARRLRDQFFESGLFEDPAWDILLDLFAAELERAQVSVSSLCIAAAVAPTTALRWIAKMTEAGLLVRHADPFDRRRAFMGLSPSALEGMRRYAGAVKRAGLGIA
jgi:DNA-binding MarR family transcriptional regulator